MINKLLNTFNSKKMTINNFEFVKNENFEAHQIDTDLDCIGVFLYKTNTENEPTLQNKRDVISDEKLRNNIWYYIVGSTQTGKIKHPAMFPEQLASDQIMSWSNVNDLVYDCFIGSGTTAIACLNTNRQFIVIEQDPNYFEKIKKRVGDFNKNFEPQTLFVNEM